jgi:hypothetical protein
MKKPKTVVEAENVLQTKKEEVFAAKDALQRLEIELKAAHQAVTEAQTEVDAELPQCRLIRMHWRDGKVVEERLVVITRSTPGGMLVVRDVGQPSGHEYKFKWLKEMGNFSQADKYSFIEDHRELRDVPAQYLPG